MLNIVSVASSVSNWSGGIGPIMRNHAYWLLKKGHKSRTVSLFDDHSVDAYSSWNGLNLKLVKPQISSFGFGLGMRDLIQNADLLHQHGTWQYSSVLAARWYGGDRYNYAAIRALQLFEGVSPMVSKACNVHLL